MKDSEKTEIILKALSKKCVEYGRLRTNVIFPELRLGSGYDDVAQRRIDLFMISSERGNCTTAFEIKVSKQDFKNDINNELKQRGTRLYSSNFYYVAPEGIISVDDLPLWAGLLEYNFDTGRFNRKVPAPLQSRNQPSWGLVCSLVRKVRKEIYLEELDLAKKEIEKLNRQLERSESLLRRIANNEVPENMMGICLNQYR